MKKYICSLFKLIPKEQYDNALKDIELLKVITQRDQYFIDLGEKMAKKAINQPDEKKHIVFLWSDEREEAANYLGLNNCQKLKRQLDHEARLWARKQLADGIGAVTVRGKHYRK